MLAFNPLQLTSMVDGITIFYIAPIGSNFINKIVIQH